MKKIMIPFAAIVLMLSLSVSAFAGSKMDDIDDSQELSLSVTFEIEGEPIEGAEVSIYKVANVYTEGGGVFYTSLVGDIDYEGMTAEESNKTASLLAEEVTDVFASAATDENGTISFANLEKGIYLVVLSEEYYADDGTQYIFDPYLVCVPLASEEDSSWDYDVESCPKVTDYITPDSDTPKTADTRHIAFWISAAVISACIAVKTTKQKKNILRYKEKEKI